MKLTLVIPVYISNELHLDFTRQTLESIQTAHDYEILIINNFCAPQFLDQLTSLLSAHCSLLPNPAGNILAASWNLGIKYAFAPGGAELQESTPGAGRRHPVAGSRGRTILSSNRLMNSDFCVIMNNDLILHPQCLDNLVKFAQKHPEFLLWSASEWSDARTLSRAKMTQSFSLHPHFSLFMLSPKTIKEVGYFDENFTFGYFEDNDYHTRILQRGFQAAATDSAKFYHYGSRTINVDDNLKIEGKYHYQQNREYFKKKWGLDIHGRAFDPPEKILQYLSPK